MAVPGSKCKKCQFCGREFGDDLAVFCPVGYKDPRDNVCWCICNECRNKLIKAITTTSQ